MFWVRTVVIKYFKLTVFGVVTLFGMQCSPSIVFQPAVNDPLLVSDSAGEQLSILTYNIQTVFGKNEDKLKALMTYINEQRYDFVVLQELFDESAREYILNNRNRSHYQSAVSRIDYNSFPELLFQDSGLFMMSRYPRVDLSLIAFDERVKVTDGAIHMVLSKELSLSTDFLANKSVMGALYKVSDATHAFIFTTHVQAIGSRGQKRRQYRQIRDFIEHAVHAVLANNLVDSSENLVVLLTGDFNSDAYDEDDLNRLTENLGAPRDLHLELHPDSKEYTMRFKLFNMYKRFDYIFAYDKIGAIPLTRIKAHAAGVTDIQDTTESSISDHLALKASIVFKKPVIASPQGPARERSAK